MASTNSSGAGVFLHSNLSKYDLLAKVDGKRDIGRAPAERIAEDIYYGNVKLNTERIIYTLDSYESSPVYAYIVNVAGKTNDNSYVNDNVVINAETGAAILSYSNIHEEITAMVSTYTEQGDRVIFPVIVSNDGVTAYYVMKDIDSPSVHEDAWPERRVTRYIGYIWDDKQDVNMREIIKWWRDNFSRNSKGMLVKVVTREKVPNWRNNAFWNGDSIFVCDIESGADYSCGAALDVMTHESTHAVVQFSIPGNLPYSNATGAINEAYADIFGALKDHNWTVAESLFKDYIIRWDPETSKTTRHYKYFFRNLSEPLNEIINDNTSVACRG